LQRRRGFPFRHSSACIRSPLPRFCVDFLCHFCCQSAQWTRSRSRDVLPISERLKLFVSRTRSSTSNPPCIHFRLREQLIGHTSSLGPRRGLPRRVCNTIWPLRPRIKAPPLSHQRQQKVGKRGSIGAARRRGTGDNLLLPRRKILLCLRWKRALETLGYWKCHRIPQQHECHSTVAVTVAAT
jgi:hypothetical protein